MKTIVHIELSDLDRNDLAKRIDRNQATKRLVTRKEVTDLMHSLVNNEIIEGRYQDGCEDTEAEPEPETPSDADSGQRGIGRGTQRVSRDADPSGFTPSRGDEDYLTSPSDPGIAAACSRILDDTALIENFAWDTVERNRKK